MIKFGYFVRFEWIENEREIQFNILHGAMIINHPRKFALKRRECIYQRVSYITCGVDSKCPILLIVPLSYFFFKTEKIGRLFSFALPLHLPCPLPLPCHL